MQDTSFDFETGVATPAWVSRCLGEPVKSVHQSADDRPAASVSRLRIQRKSGAEVHAVLKVTKKRFFNWGRSEVDFYRLAYRNNLTVTIPRFLGAETNEERRETALLIEELQGDFIPYDQTNWANPDVEHIRRIVRTLAKLHANTWRQEAAWDRKRFTRATFEAESNAATFERIIGRFLERASSIVDDRAIRAISNQLLIFVPRLLAHMDTCPAFCLIHGDVHRENLMIPHDSAEDCYLLDWANWSLDQPLVDVANLLIVASHPKFRRRHAAELLEEYKRNLAAHGIEYDEDAFWQDFRFAVGRQLAKPMIMAEITRGAPDAMWQHTLLNIFTGVEQFDVWPLLEP